MASKRTVIARAYFLSGLFFFLAVSAGLLYSATATWRYLESGEHQPIDELRVQGELRHVSPEQVRSQLQPMLSQVSFFTVDVDAVRQQLEQLPWSKRVSVRKRWPHGLSIYLTEREAVARWQQNGLLDDQAAVFHAVPGESEANLPQLTGPDNSQQRVLTMWQQLSRPMAEARLSARALTLQADGGWVLVRDDGLQLLLGSEQPVERLAVYLQVKDRLPAEHEKRRADYLDLRYDTGLAIGWQPVEQAAAQAEKKRNNS